MAGLDYYLQVSHLHTIFDSCSDVFFNFWLYAALAQQVL